MFIETGVGFPEAVLTFEILGFTYYAINANYSGRYGSLDQFN